MPAPSIPKSEVLDRLTKTFRTYGYEGASLAKLSEAAGLGRSSLYHYFPGGKEEMAQAVLAHANAWLETHVLTPLVSADSPEKRLRAMANQLESFYEGGQEACLLGIMALGDARDLFQQEISTAITSWVNAIATVFRDAGYPPTKATKLASEVVRDIQGALVLSRGLNDTKLFRDLLRELPNRARTAAQSG
ncbi:TetR/AcrR family transcriptional regulator [Leptolyngbya sp. NK1-12]|uniref:TetR/AcrR family transcriptional regulator n=1 Tax=Leptolyngbya sp. NK1-12 TaxID=2547451 RepID=A0AA96WFB8_9CYAN|nr:TetR/AcrR family transcriptional regulator [Leptolyngbya sp. NK1-12]WNZ24148.1 TetR/AcrR family transcriptional regulator [Leptolyngbya sp. NK1-12]